ncbi:MAG TPA: hypothetical protein VHI13_12785 [Candidatus Kapabacteria bacterium]|nr:hypothetical protein [Candidatus Kapabacteria bacterium]
MSTIVELVRGMSHNRIPQEMMNPEATPAILPAYLTAIALAVVCGSIFTAVSAERSDGGLRRSAARRGGFDTSVDDAGPAFTDEEFRTFGAARLVASETQPGIDRDCKACFPMWRQRIVVQQHVSNGSHGIRFGLAPDGVR